MRVRKDPAERRKELMDISMELFCSNGYEQTMVQDICQKAGVAKGTFFYYFPTKDDVLKAIFEAWTEQFVSEFTQRAKKLDAVHKLRLFLHMCARDNEIECLVDKLLGEQHKDLVKHLWQRVFMQAFTPLLREIIKKGSEKGSMRVQHIEESLYFFWSLMDALWPDEDKDNIPADSMEIRNQIASELMEALLGIEAGRLRHFAEMA